MINPHTRMKCWLKSCETIVFEHVQEGLIVDFEGSAEERKPPGYDGARANAEDWYKWTYSFTGIVESKEQEFST